MMLHIHNGDSSANILKESALPGEHLAWREALIAGPTPQNLRDDEWRRERAAHLSEAYEVKQEDCTNSLLEQDRALYDFARHKEVVLWFEHDLFCQLHLVYLLQWFAKQELGATKLSLVCVDSFPGVDDFRGLGQLNPAQMASLFDARREVSDAQLGLAAAAWQAYCAPAPDGLQEIINDDSSALPFLKDALRAHLARFPSVKNGLGQVENQALKLISEGHRGFTGLFHEFGEREAIYGLGDFQFWNELKRLMKAKTPLLIAGNTDLEGSLASGAFAKAIFELTEAGASVLEGKADFVALNGIDAWLGGVHLSGAESLWRWDEQRENLKRL
ncbi:MAG TPA: hypothetical protein VF658_14425 [Pyrinomonadaceae bacterium]|jgi:hypothetical protein